MRWILGLSGALLGALLGETEGLVLGLLGGALIGWAIERERARAAYLDERKRTAHESARLRALEARVQALEAQLAALAPASEPSAHAGPASVGDGAPANEPAEAPSVEQIAPNAAGAPAQPAAAAIAHRAAEAAAPAAGSRLPERLRALLFGGNTVVRVGVVVLTIGIALLAKHAADQQLFPLELRLAAAAALGIVLVVVGFRLRHARAGFATAIQGGGVGALYVVSFFAYHSYGLLPAGLTLALLVAIALLSSLLAVLQHAEQLAVFGAIGGFLAPILASRGEGDHVTLFSYYALLNLAIAGSALYRSWRVLLWVGFAFTFGIGSAWGALRFEPAHMASAGGFLALFFALYVLDGTLFSLRLPASRRGTIEPTLTFGTPLATLALASGMFADEPLYLALWCVPMAATYLGAARWLSSREDPVLGALAQAYVAVGICVLTLAIPFALENAPATALAWAVEASGLLWVGLRQARLRTRLGAYGLFAAALVALLARVGDTGALGRALVEAIVALSMIFAAAQLERQRGAARPWERYAGHALLGVALLLWVAAMHAATSPALIRPSLHDLALLSLAAASFLALEHAGARSGASALRSVARCASPYLLLSLPAAFESRTHPFAGLALLGWVAAIASSLHVLSRQDAQLSSERTLRDVLHASTGLLVAGLLAAEAHALAEQVIALSAGWVVALTVGAPLALPALALGGRPRWPLATYPRAYLAWSSWPVTLGVCAFALVASAASSASPAPLPYLPLLNPFEVAYAFAIITLLRLARVPVLRGTLAVPLSVWGSAASLFVLLSGAVVRTAHHWAGVPFAPWSVPDSAGVQAAFSIVWTLLALAAMLAAHHRSVRAAWLAAAALVGVVVVKLFLVDLARLGSIAKIVSFLAVGALLLLIGYVAPVPPAAHAEEKP